MRMDLVRFGNFHQPLAEQGNFKTECIDDQSIALAFGGSVKGLSCHGNLFLSTRPMEAHKLWNPKLDEIPYPNTQCVCRLETSLGCG